METLRDLLTRPAGMLAIACLAGVFLVANLALVAMLRGGGPAPDLWQRFRRSLNTEAIIWRRSVTGGSEAQKLQADQLDELHQLVTQLQEPPDGVGSDPSK